MIVEHRSPMPASAAEVFAWHARPGAFERLVPPWERVRLHGPHPGLAPEARVEFEVDAGPIVTTWVARHTVVEPPNRFVDLQERGPFAHWRHEHLFEPAGTPESSTLMDRVDLTLPGGPLGELAEPCVRRRVRRALGYRHRILAGDLALHAAYPRRALTVALTGASGLVGRPLAASLSAGGHRVIRLVRRAPGPEEVQWAPGPISPRAFDGVDAVIHLAGENIAEGRWTEARRRAIRTSRVETTARLAEAIAAASPRPKAFLVASAMGWYGDRGDELLDEESSPGQGFLADVGQAWEAASDPARQAGVRTAALRFGLILTPAGGALGRMLPPFRLGVGGPIGDGQAWMSWIGIDDAIGAVVHLLHRDDLQGPVNVAAPTPVRNHEFTRVLGHVLRRPTLLPVPALALRAIFGTMADETLLASTRLAPTVLERSGYRFRHRELEPALRHLMGSVR